MIFRRFKKYWPSAEANAIPYWPFSKAKSLYPKCAKQKCWYFLDELQTVEGWENYARRLVDSSKIQLSLMGYSSKLLSEEIATEMRGRSIPIEVFPLSFPEYVRFNGIMDSIPSDGWTERERGTLQNAMRQYLERGGFPDVQNVSAGIRSGMLQGYVDAVLYRDVLERHEVPSVQALRYTMEYLFHNFARKISTRAIVGVLRQMGVATGRESIADYLDYFKDAYLAYPVSIRSDSLAVKRVNPDKIYLVDTGLIRAMNAKMDQEKGWLLENLVFMSLRHRNLGRRARNQRCAHSPSLEMVRHRGELTRKSASSATSTPLPANELPREQGLLRRYLARDHKVRLVESVEPVSLHQHAVRNPQGQVTHVT